MYPTSANAKSTFPVMCEGTDLKGIAKQNIIVREVYEVSKTARVAEGLNIEMLQKYIAALP